MSDDPPEPLPPDGRDGEPRMCIGCDARVEAGWECEKCAGDVDALVNHVRPC
jgi:hypothetical protein